MPENEFTNVDDSGSAEELAGYLDVIARLPAIQEARQAAFDALKARPGDRILELGCGTGESARALAARVGPGGLVVGIDSSRAMIEMAARRAAAHPCLAFLCGDASALSFPNRCFDGCVIERTLIHLSRPLDALAELVRVAKTGATVAALEADVDTLGVDDGGAEFSAPFRRFLSNLFRNPRIGAFLARHFHSAGLEDVTVRAHVMVFREFALFKAAFALNETLGAAVQSGTVPAGEAVRWIKAFAKADADGVFFAAGTIFVVSGRKP